MGCMLFQALSPVVAPISQGRGVTWGPRGCIKVGEYGVESGRHFRVGEEQEEMGEDEF